jgi:tetratricopeptide (TPR) repeat protein
MDVRLMEMETGRERERRRDDDHRPPWRLAMDKNARPGGNLPAGITGRPGRRGRPWALAALVATLALAPAAWATQCGEHDGGPTAEPAPMLLQGLGLHGHRITTASPEAQAYFDQGLRLVYAFNHIEAERSFREAARLDPACAMCYWGIALTHGSNYNSPADAAREQAAHTAVQQAVRLADRATPRERAMIEALATRHVSPPPTDRGASGRAYADAMRDVVRRFPDDADAATLFADALMNLRPWNLWMPDGTPQPETPEILATLEQALRIDPGHPGALHLYIHAVEAGPDPGRGEAAADRLAPLMPGAGHIVHMPSHIYLRVGRYADAVEVNVRAAAADRAYFALREPSPIYRGMYYPHNLDFIWAAARMEGRSADTIRAAREFAESVPPAMLREMPDMETAPAAPLFALARFGRWEEILRQPEPPAEWPYARGAWHYARGLAFVATGRRPEADRELEALRATAARVSAERSLAGNFKTKAMLGLAAEVLAGEIAARSGRTDLAVRHLRAAVAEQDGHWFTEPPPWYFPVRQALGAALLEGGRAAEAEAVYREDLRRNPENGWSLFGLAQSLRAQGKAVEAAEVEARFQKAWARADVVLTASRF